MRAKNTNLVNCCVGSEEWELCLARTIQSPSSNLTLFLQVEPESLSFSFNTYWVDEFEKTPYSVM